MDDNRRLDFLAGVAHGGLFALHTLGAVYFGCRDEKDVDDWSLLAFHVGAAVVDVVSAREHLKE